MINQNHDMRDYREHYTSELIDITGQFFKQALNIFDYEFENRVINKPYYFSEEFSKLDWQKCMDKTKF